MTDIAQIAGLALTILNRDGWCKFALTDFQGRHCLGGAWNLAELGTDQWAENSFEVEPSPVVRPSVQALADAINDQYPQLDRHPWPLFRHPATQIAKWNNSPEITEDDVRAILGKLAAG